MVMVALTMAECRKLRQRVLSNGVVEIVKEFQASDERNPHQMACVTVGHESG